MKKNNKFNCKRVFVIAAVFSLGILKSVIYVFGYNAESDKVEKPDFEDEDERQTYGSLMDVTVVTAYFDIGSFPKGSYSNRRHNETYYEWAKIYRYIQNNVVAFTDSEIFRDKMLHIRKDLLHRTRILMVQKENAWPFQNLKKVTEIFNTTSYAKFLPNTVYPLYSCVQQAKYYVLQIAIEKDFFRTKYIMWLDIGLFRDRKSTVPFYMSRPKGFNESRIAMTKVFPSRNFKVKPEIIIKKNGVIVCGALAFGERFQMLKFAKQFKRAVDYFLEQNLTNTDQQIIYALFSEKAKQTLKPEVQLQMYSSEKKMDWFYLGYNMVKEVSDK